MQQINPFRFYELAAKLHGLLGGLSQNKAADMLGSLTETQAVLDNLIKGDPLLLEASKPDATRLLNKISAIFNKYFIDPSTKQVKSQDSDDRFDSHEVAMVGALIEKFEHALAADLNRAPTYVAQKCGIYSTYDLIENAQQTFSPELRAAMMPSALAEFNTAGRALAFGLSAAAGMHLIRSIEISLKQYYELFVSSSVSKAERNYNIYLKKLASLADDESNAARPDKRLLQMLAQIKEHYRNPLASPEGSISTDDATSLFGLATAVMTLMAEQALMRKKQDVAVKDAKSSLSNVINDPEDEGYDFRMSQAS